MKNDSIPDIMLDKRDGLGSRVAPLREVQRGQGREGGGIWRFEGDSAPIKRV